MVPANRAPVLSGYDCLSGTGGLVALIYSSVSAACEATLLHVHTA